MDNMNSMDYEFCDEIIEPTWKLSPKETAKKDDPDNYLYNDYTKKYCLKKSFTLQNQGNIIKSENGSGYTHSSNVVNYLLDKYKDDQLTIDNFLTNLLVVSIKLRQVKKMHFILNKGVNVNRLDFQGISPLIMAVFLNKFKIVKMLVEKYGADLNMECSDKRKCWQNAKNMANYLINENENNRTSKKIYDYITEKLTEKM